MSRIVGVCQRSVQHSVYKKTVGVFNRRLMQCRVNVRSHSDCNNILFNVNLIKELIILTAYYIVWLRCDSMCNSHEYWMNNLNFTENKQTIKRF